jgi:hypothetical protein
LSSQRSSARLHRGRSALLAKQWKTRLRQPAKKPQREFNIFFQNSLAASAAKANCDAASETLSGTRFVLSIVAQQASRN